MSPSHRNLAILAGVVVLAGGGAAAYFATRPAAPAATPPGAAAGSQAAASIPPLPASPATAGAASDPAAAEPGNVSGQDVASVEFTSAVQPFSLVHDTTAYVQATTDAPQMYALRAGTPFESVEKSKDGKWLVALTADGQAAFLPAGDAGPYDARQASQLALPATITGSARVIDTATLSIDDQTVPLTGVRGETGDYADQLQALIDAQGKQVSCTLSRGAYVCTLQSGLDIARTALFNGAAEPSDDASNDYRQQADAAKAARKGIWQ